VAFALVTSISAEIPMPPCTPNCVVSTYPGR
jgi:hypothetical protein